MTQLIYKIMSKQEWANAESEGVFKGAAIDLSDGYIHFSAANQVAETAAKHFGGRSDLVLVTVDTNQLSGDLKWEVSRNGELFPHLYGDLDLSAVVSVVELTLNNEGTHRFPSLEP